METKLSQIIRKCLIKEANEKLDNRKLPFIPKLDGEEFIGYSDLSYEVAEENKHITNDYNIASILQYIKCNNTVSNSNTNGILEDIYYTKKCESIISKDTPQYVIISSKKWLSAWVEVDDPKNTTSIYYLIGAVDRGIIINIDFGDFAFVDTLRIIGKYFSNIPVVHTGMMRVNCLSKIPHGLNSIISNLCAVETNCLKITGRELNISDKDGIHTYKIDAYNNIVLDK